MREIFERLERLGVSYYLTGSEALARYGQPRQTMDIDVVVDIGPTDFGQIEAAFADGFLVNPPIDFGGHLLASIMPLSALGKADLILGRHDSWSKSAMARRQSWQHPSYGTIWVISLEDLILAKLAWSEGTSELQLRDCRNLIALNRERLDWAYLKLWAEQLGLVDALEAVRHAA